MKPILGIVLLLMAFSANANTMGAVLAKVTGTGTYANGSIYVFFDRQISSCSTDDGRIDIAATSPARDQILSVAMTAFVSGRSVKIRPASCDGQTSVFDGYSYLYLSDT